MIIYKTICIRHVVLNQLFFITNQWNALYQLAYY